MKRSAIDALLAVLGLLLLAFYFWTAANGRAFDLGEPPDDALYPLLADALLHGQLHLRVEPSPELFELAQPYEPSKNVSLRLQDASLYRGHYYVYFGVAPALLLFVPWQLMGGGGLPEPLGAAILASGGLLSWALNLRHLVRSHMPATPAWIEAGLLLVLGLSSVVPFMLRGANVYEVAILGGYLFMGLATWFFLTAAEGAPGPAFGLTLGGFCLGLAVGCRPNHLLVAPLVLLLAGPALGGGRGRLRTALFPLVSFSLILFLLGAYNHARFGSWTEFGTTYQVGGSRPVPWLDPRAVAPALYYHLLAPPVFRPEFPFIIPYAEYPGSLPTGFFADAHTTGALLHAPFLLILVGAPWLLRRAPVRELAQLRFRVAVLTAVGLGSPLLTSATFSAAAMRYEADFVTFLIVPALLLWLVADRQAVGRGRALLRAAGVLVLGWSLLAGLVLSLSGAGDVLHIDNPVAFATLERRFEPVRMAFGRLFVRGGRGVARMRVAFPERLGAEREPLLSSCPEVACDVLWVRQVGQGLFSLELETGEGSRHQAAPRWFEGGRFYDFVVELDHVGRRLRLTVDGRETFDLAARIGQVRPDRIRVGCGPQGLRSFSGSIIPEAMMLAGPSGLDRLPPISSRPAIYADAEAPRPAVATPGQLWVAATQEGADLFTGTGWRWIPRFFLDRVRVDRRVSFSAAPFGSDEPLLCWGDRETADAVFVRRLGGGRLGFGLARWRGAWQRGPTGPATDGGTTSRALRVTVDRVQNRVVVLLDGWEVLRTTDDLAPLARSGILLGRSPTGMALGRGTLSGRIEAPAPQRADEIEQQGP